MTTYADRPLRDTAISRPKSRPKEIERTLDQRFGIPHRQTPSTLNHLVEAVATALKTGDRLRMIGSGRGESRASNPVGTTTLSSEKLSKIYKRGGRDIQGLRLRKGLNPKTVVRAQAGIPFRTLLQSLTSESTPRTFINHGSGDFQSVVGALSTGTHGTGPTPSFAGLVRAIVVVRVDDTGPTPVPRIELIQPHPKSSTGQTACYRVPKSGFWMAGHHKVYAVNDDAIFHAHTVGLGCLGLVYCVTLAVEPKVPLMLESRTPERLSDIFNALGKDLRNENLRCEIIVDPYPRVTTGPPKKWKEVGVLPPTMDFSTFRGQYVLRSPSDAPKPKGSLPLSMKAGRMPEAAGLIGDRIGNVLENPVAKGPDGAQSMIACSSVERYIDWLPNVLLLNLKYTGTGSEWAVPRRHVKEAMWQVLRDTWQTYHVYQGQSDAKGRFTGSEEELIDLLEMRAPVMNGPAIRFVDAEDALLAGSNRFGPDGRAVKRWAMIELGFLGQPGIEKDWRPRKRHFGLRPEQPIPRSRVDQMLGRLRAEDAVDPDDPTREPPVNLNAIRSPSKRREMRLFAAYERGRQVTLDRLTAKICTPTIGGRPHQGLNNDLSWHDVERMWSKTAQTWRNRFAVANPSGTFDNALTDRWNLRSPAPPSLSNLVS